MGKCESGTIGAGLHPGQGPTVTFVARLRGAFSLSTTAYSAVTSWSHTVVFVTATKSVASSAPLATRVERLSAA